MIFHHLPFISCCQKTSGNIFQDGNGSFTRPGELTFCHGQSPFFMGKSTINGHFHIELDDGKIFTGKPDQFDDKNHGFRFSDFPNKTNPMNFRMEMAHLPSSELTFCHGQSPFFMGKSTISMAIFNSKLLVYQRLRIVP